MVLEHGPCTYALIPSIEEKCVAMSYYYDDSSKDDYEQYEKECERYEEVLSICSSFYNFIRDEGYYYDHVYYEYVCAKILGFKWVSHNNM